MSREISAVQLTYFSGTGGTRRVAEAFERELLKRELAVSMNDLTSHDGQESQTEERDTALYILIFPVYAFDAPMPVIHWIRDLGSEMRGKKAAVISVSGGGEVWPNTGCRNRSCKELEAKGLSVIYDGMMCMPANMLMQVDDHLAMRLISVIPEKVNCMLDDILSGTVRRTHYRKGPLRKYLTKLENEGAYKFAQGLTVTDNCKSCGWCVKNCPTANIEIPGEGIKPQFLDRCTVCLRCIYGCPFHAIKTKTSVVFRSGFDLNALEQRMEGVALAPVASCCPGIMLKGVKKYLMNKN